MKILQPFLAIFLFHIGLLAFSQEERIVSGIMKDNDGSPLPGVSIVIKGTVTGTLTNMDGYYKIKVPLGAILTYSYIGLKTTEVTVTLQNSKPSDETILLKEKKSPKMKSSFSPLKEYHAPADTTLMEGTSRFTETTPSFKIENQYNQNIVIDPGKIGNIRINEREGTISLQTDKFYTIPHVSFSTSATMDRPSRLPALQNQYAQGHPENGEDPWRGPETGEIFSWGPRIDNMEFDGSAYPFDKNGRLVPQGTGNGSKAKTYDPKDFFRNGSALQHTLKISQTDHKKDISFLYGHQVTNGMIPDSRKTGQSITLNALSKGSKLKFEYRLFYDGYHSNLLNDNPVLNVIMASVLTTPPTFDNANGYPSGKALTHKDAYELDQTTQRSSSPVNNNPYWLVNHLTDREVYSSFTNSLAFRSTLPRNLSLNIQSSLGQQIIKNTVAYPEFIATMQTPHLTNRSDKLQSFHTIAVLNYLINNYRFEFQNSLDYDFNYAKRALHRTDAFMYMSQNLNNSPSRNTNNITLTTNLNLSQIFIFKMTNNIINSSTLPHVLYNPGLSAGLNLHEIIGRRSVLNFFKLKGNWGYVYSEVPLTFSYGYNAYQSFSNDNFLQSEFDHEVLPDFSLKPVKVLKKGLGMDITMFQNRFNLTMDYYRNRTTNELLAVQENGYLVLKNLADNKTSGWEAAAYVQSNSWRRWHYKINATFSAYKTTVIRLHEGYTEVPLGGFADAHTVLLEGQPYGVIVGTAYRRNDQGQLVIDADGYPLVDEKLHVLGNPNPEYRAGLETMVSYKTFNVTCLFEFSKGGKIWNGTQNRLSYLGQAAQTTDDRKVTGYVYQGMKEDGTVNTTLVDFANPAKDLSTNRWVRYGASGVAETGIQDASWFRIREISASYKVPGRYACEITLFVRNPLLITHASGVDPETALWGNHHSTGLDMFNMPGQTSYGINFKISI
jgi:hypothetical protein